GSAAGPTTPSPSLLLPSCFQLDASPGYCWPSPGSRIEVLIRLPVQIRPMAVTIQHPAKMAALTGPATTAPQDCTVFGLDGEGGDEALLGTFTYALQEGLTQTFPLQNGVPRAFRFLKLSMQSTWGKAGYTCSYRVQVHGKILGS
ncbi:SPAG4 protein, partial [Rhynochetos jubatus]|nr:SPAG4 protein [Rhynochetos jubatus]